jgi:Tfp pilus assembly protein PilO
MVDSSPMIKVASMIVAIVVAILLVCGCVLCCYYFSLEQRFDELQMTVTQQQQETGLPDEFEFNEEDVTIETN